MDGARVGAALTSAKNDMTLADILELTDIFWIGGTKNGALLGEAVIMKGPALAEDFEFYIKQPGSLLAKNPSWVLSLRSYSVTIYTMILPDEEIVQRKICQVHQRCRLRTARRDGDQPGVCHLTYGSCARASEEFYFLRLGKVRRGLGCGATAHHLGSGH